MGKMSGAARIPSVRFDTGLFEKALRLEALRESTQGVWRVEPDRASRRPVMASGSGWRLGNVVVSHLLLGKFAQIGLKGSASQGMVQVRLYRTGGSLAFFGEETGILRPGTVHVFDSTFQIHTLEDCELYSLSIPADQIGYDRSLHGAHLVFPAEQATGHVLASAIAGLIEALPIATVDQIAALSAMVAGVFRGVLLGSKSDEEARQCISRMRTQAMVAFVRQNLDAADIGVDRLCQQFETSRATAFRAFAAEGGIDRFIANERLDRALSDLTSEPQIPGRVTRVAQRWHFYDASHFNRAFRRRHGYAPSEIPARYDEPATEEHAPAAQVRGKLVPLLTNLYG